MLPLFRFRTQLGVVLVTGLATWLLYACSSQQATATSLLAEPWQPLAVDKTLDADAVEQYAFDAVDAAQYDSLRAKADRLYLQGVKAFVNENKVQEGANRFAESATLFPKPETYFLWGKALVALNRTEEALKALEISDRLGYTSPGAVAYEKARVQALALTNPEQGAWKVYQELDAAAENGFLTRRDLDRDAAFNRLRNTEGWRPFVERVFRQHAERTTAQLFKDFLAGFPVAPESGFAFAPEEDIQQQDRYINFDFAEFIPEMENTSFGRDVSNTYHYVALVRSTPEFVTVVYANQSAWGGDAGSSLTAVSFTPQGQRIDKRVVACRCSRDRWKGFKYHAGVFTLREVQPEWKYHDRPPVPCPSESPDGDWCNQLVALKAFGTEEQWAINPQGRFIAATSVPDVAAQ
jgi:hypothetical protein